MADIANKWNIVTVDSVPGVTLWDMWDICDVVVVSDGIAVVGGWNEPLLAGVVVAGIRTHHHRRRTRCPTATATAFRYSPPSKLTASGSCRWSGKSQCSPCRGSDSALGVTPELRHVDRIAAKPGVEPKA
jgi:hypothetical protein